MPKLIIVPGEPQRKRIVVQTRRGSDIDNFQAEEISQSDLAAVGRYRQRYPLAVERTRPSPTYNCHGLTFASRRTRIPDAGDVAKVLAEDDYVDVPMGEVMPGDVVIYSRDGDLRHSGVVLQVRHEGGLTTPMILSKWGDCFEAIHSQFECPYTESTAIRYYRIEE